MNPAMLCFGCRCVLLEILGITTVYIDYAQIMSVTQSKLFLMCKVESGWSQIKRFISLHKKGSKGQFSSGQIQNKITCFRGSAIRKVPEIAEGFEVVLSHWGKY